MLSTAANLRGAALNLAETPIQTWRLKWNVVTTEGHECVEKKILEFGKIVRGDFLASFRDHSPVLEVFVLTHLPKTLVLEITKSEHAISESSKKLLVNLG